MTTHADAGRVTVQRVAGEVRAELARQKRTAGDLAAALDMTAHTIGRRLNGEVPFDVFELARAAIWLGVPLARFMAPPGDQTAA